MSFSNIIHEIAAAQNSPATTSAANSSGGDILISHAAMYMPSAPVTFFDSKGNTWVKLTPQDGVSFSHSQLAYVKNPTVGAGHTASAAGNDPIYTAFNFAAFSGADTIAPFNAENGAVANNASTIQTGSVSPYGTDLFVTGVFLCLQASCTIDGIFTILDQIGYSSTNYFGGAMAWAESGSLQNPTWTLSGTETLDFSATIASFKAAAVSAASGSTMLSMGVG